MVAGLPDLFFNENRPGFSSVEFREELRAQLTPPDFDLIRKLYLPFDNKNFLTVYFNLDKPFDPLGNFTKDYFETQLLPANEHCTLPGYMIRFLEWMKSCETSELTYEVENILHTLFYESVLKTKNEFLSEWFSFELNVKNLLTTFNCVRFNRDPANHLIKAGSNLTAYHLLLNKRLKPELFEDEIPYHDQLFRIAESETDMMEKEKALDRIRWNYLDEFTFFHFFTIEKIASYIIKLNIIERWNRLDEKTGRELLNKLLNELKTSYEFPAEFSLTK